MISGFYDGVRCEDHRMIECLFDDIDRYSSNFWQQMFERTGVVMLVPETKSAWISSGQKLTDSQRRIIDKLDYNLIED